ncbi:unnamed protein product [Amoebophrya sp. A25]|nr:unnamed protein product [Amoebophrya sp. A25]|eukprot:GSA25T00012099001.1
MDNNASALFREGLETEKRMSFKWMQEMDLSDAKDIPTDVQYQSSSIAAQPFKKHLVMETKGFKPQIKKENFERSKKNFGMCNSELAYQKARNDPRPIAQCFRTGRADEMQMKQAPPALRQTEYYGKPDATAGFYRPSGAFAAVEDK